MASRVTRSQFNRAPLVWGDPWRLAANWLKLCDVIMPTWTQISVSGTYMNLFPKEFKPSWRQHAKVTFLCIQGHPEGSKFAGKENWKTFPILDELWQLWKCKLGRACVCIPFSSFSKLLRKFRRIRWECQHRISSPAGRHQLGVGLLRDPDASKYVCSTRLGEGVCVHFHYVS